MLYFGYGMNMDIMAMRRRCPGARLVGVASLADHKFIINSRGVSTVVPHQNSTVYGVVWEINNAHLDSLDMYEGVAGGFYTRDHRTVTLANGREITTIVYFATCEQHGTARPNYITKVVAAARYHNLPLDYRAELGRWLPRRNTHQNRTPNQNRKTAFTGERYTREKTIVLGNGRDLSHLGSRWANVPAR